MIRDILRTTRCICAKGPQPAVPTETTVFRLSRFVHIIRESAEFSCEDQLSFLAKNVEKIFWWLICGINETMGRCTICGKRKQDAVSARRMILLVPTLCVYTTGHSTRAVPANSSTRSFFVYSVLNSYSYLYSMHLFQINGYIIWVLSRMMKVWLILRLKRY